MTLFRKGGGRWLRFAHRDSRSDTARLMLLALALLAIALMGDRLLWRALPGLVHPLLTVVIVLLLLMVPAALCRRLHDRDWRGSWLLLPVLTGLGAVALSLLQGPPTGRLSPGAVLLLLGTDGLLLVTFAALIWLLLQLLRPGTTGPNRFGLPPDKRDISR